MLVTQSGASSNNYDKRSADFLTRWATITLDSAAALLAASIAMLSAIAISHAVSQTDVGGKA